MKPFKEVEIEVKKLEDYFNESLVALLNNCDEPIVLGVDPTFWKRHTAEDCKKHPVSINIAKKEDLPATASPVYSASSKKVEVFEFLGFYSEPKNGKFWYQLYINKESPKEKFPLIKEAIEKILNNE